MAIPESADALVAALLELDRYVGRDGWDQPPRLFALVLTDVLAAAEPALSRELGLRTTEAGGPPNALTAIEQDEFRSSGDLTGDLAAVEWPETVSGCALTTVRTFLPAAYEADLPTESAAAAAAVAAHPQRQEIRVVVGVDRAGNRHGVGRLASRPEELLGAPDLVPGLASALAHTLC
jgi:hypothetical protein